MKLPSPIGAVNSYVCLDCKWATITVNLATGLVPDEIPCLGKQKHNPDQRKILFNGSKHKVVSNNFEPQPWWLTSNERLLIDRGFIRPSQDQLLLWATDQDLVVDIPQLSEFAESLLLGKLFMVPLDREYDQAPAFPMFGRDAEATKLYLTHQYNRVLDIVQ